MQSSFIAFNTFTAAGAQSIGVYFSLLASLIGNFISLFILHKTLAAQKDNLLFQTRERRADQIVDIIVEILSSEGSVSKFRSFDGIKSCAEKLKLLLSATEAPRSFSTILDKASVGAYSALWYTEFRNELPGVIAAIKPQEKAK